jgi:hypothetical protein
MAEKGRRGWGQRRVSKRRVDFPSPADMQAHNVI